MRRSKKILALALAAALALLPSAALAAEEKPERGVLTYTEHIKPQYEDAQGFSDGLAAVKKNGKWGYIDTDGKVVIPFRYDQAYPFNEGKAVVGMLADTEDLGVREYYDEGQDEWLPDPDGVHDYLYHYSAGFLDKNGRHTPFRDGDGKQAAYLTGSQEVTNSFGNIFHNGYAILTVELGQGGDCLYDAGGKEVRLTYREGDYESWAMPLDYPVNEGYAATYEGMYNLASHTLLTAPAWTEDGEEFECYGGCRPFNQGLAPVWLHSGYSGYGEERLGFMDTSGRWAIEPFPAGSHWINGVETIFRIFGETGLAIIQDQQGMYGAIDKSGQTAIPFQYEDLRIISEGLIPFKSQGKYGYLDAGDLSVAIPAQYDNATSFNNGLAVAVSGDSAFLIDWKGNPVPGADKLKTSVYFREDEDGGMYYTNPDEYVVIEERGRYGYGHVEYLPNLPGRDEMSPWAYDDVTAAIEENFVPVYLQNLYLNNIKRGEFCDTVIQAVTEILDTDAEALVKARTGKTLSDWEKGYPFNDSTDSSVIAAYALGIVAGRGDGTFDPYATISRQEAAAFLTRGAKVLGMDTAVIQPSDFADGGDVAEWARDSVSYVSQIKVMNGTGEDRFTPLGSYSREQSFATIYRLYQAMLAQQ